MNELNTAKHLFARTGTRCASWACLWIVAAERRQDVHIDHAEIAGAGGRPPRQPDHFLPLLDQVGNAAATFDHHRFADIGLQAQFAGVAARLADAPCWKCTDGDAALSVVLAPIKNESPAA
jgi:hypothetical protein